MTFVLGPSNAPGTINSHNKPNKYNKYIKKHNRNNNTANTRCKSTSYGSIINNLSMDTLDFVIGWLESVIQAFHIVALYATTIICIFLEKHGYGFNKLPYAGV